MSPTKQISPNIKYISIYFNSLTLNLIIDVRSSNYCLVPCYEILQSLRKPLDGLLNSWIVTAKWSFWQDSLTSLISFGTVFQQKQLYYTFLKLPVRSSWVWEMVIKMPVKSYFIQENKHNGEMKVTIKRPLGQAVKCKICDAIFWKVQIIT